MKMLAYIGLIALSILGEGCAKMENQEIMQDLQYPIGVVHTDLGKMYFWLYDETPNHKAKFIELANGKVYDEYSFNRVVRNFVIQGGCPDSVKYFENSPYLLDPEFVDSLGHSYGALGMGRDDNPKKQSNACQFYIVNKEQGLPQLDGNYMIFGKIIKGVEVLEAIEKVPTDNTDTPIDKIPLSVTILHLTKAQLLADFGFVLNE
jgi:peptidyl-prolyl cis-trans isomerase B (cyclophilin B)